MKKIIIVLLSLIFLIIFLGISWLRIKGNLKGRINLVLAGEKIAIFSLTPEEIVFLNIPQGVFLETVGGYGPYKIESIYGLGKLKGQGGELLSQTIQESFGMPIDGFIANLNNFQSKEIKQLFLILLKKRGETNLSKMDIFRIWLAIGKIPRSKFVDLELTETDCLKQKLLPDGTLSYELKPENTFELIKKIFIDPQIKEENLSLAFLNATNHSGLANRGARLISNIGGRVVKLGEWEGKISQCQVIAPKSIFKSYTLQKIIKIFDCQRQEGEEKVGEYRAEVIVILGENYWRKLTGI